MVGKAHVPGIMKLLQRNHGFQRIAMKLKSEAAHQDSLVTSMAAAHLD
jgi:hypothetical protein